MAKKLSSLVVLSALLVSFTGNAEIKKRGFGVIGRSFSTEATLLSPDSPPVTGVLKRFRFSYTCPLVIAGFGVALIGAFAHVVSQATGVSASDLLKDDLLNYHTSDIGLLAEGLGLAIAINRNTPHVVFSNPKSAKWLERRGSYLVSENSSLLRQLSNLLERKDKPAPKRVILKTDKFGMLIEVNEEY